MTKTLDLETFTVIFLTKIILAKNLVLAVQSHTMNRTVVLKGKETFF